MEWLLYHNLKTVSKAKPGFEYSKRSALIPSVEYFSSIKAVNFKDRALFVIGYEKDNKTFYG